MKLPRIFVLLVGLALAQASFAQTSFYAILTQSQEGPPTSNTPPVTSTAAPRPQAYGFASFTLNPAMTALTMFVQVFNIDVTAFTGAPITPTGSPQSPDGNDDLRAAHIHAPAPPGSNASVVWGFFGTPDHDTMPKNTSLVPFASGLGGTFTGTWDAPEGVGTLAGQLASIFAGLAYINFHTTQFGGGEIRGQILLAPEPASTAALLGLATLGLFVARRRTAKS